MKMEYRKVNDGILQCTFSDERWYSLDDGETFYPSNSWIASFWPKGRGFEEWLKKNGDEAEQIKKDAGAKGSKIHQAIEDLLSGAEVKCDAVYMNNDTQREEDLSVDEYSALLTFAAWWKELGANHKVRILKVEQSAINKEFGVGYTLDLLIEVDGQTWLVDFKTSKDLYMSHKLQTWLMKHGEKADRAFLLQIGYTRNKSGYKLTEVEEDLSNEYKSCLTIFNVEVAENDKQPKQREFPLSVKLEANA